MIAGGIFRPGMRGYFIPFVAGVVLAVSAFLPWVIVGGVSLNGVPDVWALWVAGLGALAAVLAMLSLITRRNSRHPLLVIGHRGAADKYRDDGDVAPQRRLDLQAHKVTRVVQAAPARRADDR